MSRWESKEREEFIDRENILILIKKIIVKVLIKIYLKKVNIGKLAQEIGENIKKENLQLLPSKITISKKKRNLLKKMEKNNVISILLSLTTSYSKKLKVEWIMSELNNMPLKLFWLELILLVSLIKHLLLHIATREYLRDLMKKCGIIRELCMLKASSSAIIQNKQYDYKLMMEVSS